jgi:hypothetical protein
MTTASEFREDASECLEWADGAETEDQRESFVDMAKQWTLAAFRHESAFSQGRDGQPHSETPGP